MKDSRLQLRCPQKLKKDATRAAKRRGTTLSAIVVQHLQNLVDADKIEKMTGTEPDAEQI